MIEHVKVLQDFPKLRPKQDKDVRKTTEEVGNYKRFQFKV